MKTLSIIGCGRVGRTLGRLWSKRGVFQIGDVVNRTQAVAVEAADFVGAGRALGRSQDLFPADFFMIGVQDRYIADCARDLAASGVLRRGDTVFHCSGSLPSTVLQDVVPVGALIASVHPLRSFTAPGQCVAGIDGTYCGAEGQAQALEVLRPAFEAIGGVVFELRAQRKTDYHTASVVACNYVTALLEVALRTYERAGLDRAQALAAIDPLVRGALDNVLSQGTAAALTGPIARGDAGVVAGQLSSLGDWEPRYRELYRLLGSVALDLARERGDLAPDSLKALSTLLEPPNQTPG